MFVQTVRVQLCRFDFRHFSLLNFSQLKGSVHPNYQKTYFPTHLHGYLSQADSFSLMCKHHEMSICLHSSKMEVNGILFVVLTAFKNDA